MMRKKKKVTGRTKGLYVLVAKDPALSDKRVKVGYTSESPKARLKSCLTGSPIPIFLQSFRNGGTVHEERIIHQALRGMGKSRPGAGSEWFYFDEETENLLREWFGEGRVHQPTCVVQCPVCGAEVTGRVSNSAFSCTTCGAVCHNNRNFSSAHTGSP